MNVEALVTIVTKEDGREVKHPPGSLVPLDDATAKVFIAQRFARPAPVAAPIEAPTPPVVPPIVSTAGATGAEVEPPPAPPNSGPAPDGTVGQSDVPSGSGPVQGAGVGGEVDPDRAILDGFELLEEGNKGHWTADGRPDVRALSAIVGFKVVAADRDRLWAKHSADRD